MRLVNSQVLCVAHDTPRRTNVTTGNKVGEAFPLYKFVYLPL